MEADTAVDESSSANLKNNNKEGQKQTNKTLNKIIFFR